ncbi:hypothetical protein LEM8419_00884 [Neolewinella maritima]|uniref:Uncharacterized protein n=1 Tax=Neolewinella maritima TaxID=1383882 RepID=A0ABN8F6D0_9BACT|nr:hypothetical protein [Neolewinella maritima]CAH0999584.1 hypothetical protein LEM8419_00884 [Neolewinella maritima]
MGNGITFLQTDTTYFYDGLSGGTGRLGGSGHFVGQNPSNDARILYYADKRHTFGKMYVEIYRDTQLIRTLQAGKSAGLNAVSLPITTEKPKSPPTDNRMARWGARTGPSLEAGTYRVKLIKGKNTYETAFTLAPRPGSPYSLADRNSHRELLLQLYDDTEQVAYLHAVLEHVAEQADTSGHTALTEQARQLQSQLVFLGGDGYVNEGEQLGESVTSLYGNVAGFPGQPSDSQVAEARRLRGEIAALQEEVDALLAEVRRLNEGVAEEQQITYPDKASFLATE